ncbi:MAG: site-specific DNA-methyltransferase [Candidatus Lokiarchaeota archaeon]|nr:site-specific DNA-methyltransferase [Candidatus Lokiarchaeota archaeon]
MVQHENSILLGDCRALLKELDDASIDTCITSPPYWGCRDYGAEGQVGIEQNPFDYVTELASIFATIKEKLKLDGNVFIIIDDVWVSNWTRCRQHTWISSKDQDEGISNEDIQDKCKIPRNWPKTLGMDWFKAKQKMLLPERLTIKMQEEQGWYFREKLVWYKPNAGNYTNIRDRFAHAYEYILHFTKNQQYHVNMNAIKDPETGKLQRDVLSIPIERNASAHSATFPKALVELLVDFTCPAGGIVLDPFCGTGTTLVVAKAMKRRYVGIELSPAYHAEAVQRLASSEGHQPRGKAGNLLEWA